MKKSNLIASSLVLVIIVWMLAGYFFNDATSETTLNTHPDGYDSSLITVEVRTQTATPIARHIVAQGHVAPNRVVTLRAETEGRVAELVAQEGRSVNTHDVLVRLEMKDRQARLKKAHALLRERQSAHERAIQLGEKGFQAKQMVNESFAALTAAQAELENIQLEISHTVIKVPFDGILEKRHVNVGDYVAVNGQIATVVDNNPLVISVHIPQQDIEKISLGSVADAAFATGQLSKGSVRYIAPRAEEATRTFRVEIEVSNTGNLIPAGISAETSLPTGVVAAHFISPAILSLSDSGQVGVKTVNEEDIVEFHPITLVLSEARGIWVSGLPDTARIITVGQGFARAGDAVRISSTQGVNPVPAVTADFPDLSPAGPNVPEKLL